MKKAKEHFDAADSEPDGSRAAVESLREVLRLDPNNAEYQYQFIVRLYNTRQYSECARRGSEFARRPNAHGNIALYAAAAFKDLKDYKSALSLMDDLLKKVNEISTEELYKNILPEDLWQVWKAAQTSHTPLPSWAVDEIEAVLDEHLGPVVTK